MAANSYSDAQGYGTTVDLHKESSGIHQVDAVRYAAMELISHGTVTAALKVAIELGVFEILAKAGAAGQKSSTAKEIAEQLVRPAGDVTVVNHAYLQRILRLLASVNVVSERVVVVTATEPGSYKTHHRHSYEITPVGKYFVRGEDGTSLVAFTLMVEDWVFKKPREYLSAAIFDDSVDPFVRAHGKSAFQLSNEDPRFNKLFNAGMSGNSRIYMEAVLGAYHGFQDVNCLVDVGGGTGTSLALITAKYPHIRGINFDLPHVIATAPANPRVEFLGGNMFESVPSGDAIFMKWILHDWSDEECVTILRNCFKALPSGGKVIIMESVLPNLINLQSEYDGARSLLGLVSDVAMLTLCSGGAKERTLHEFQELADIVGFKSLTLVVTIDYISVLEFTKATI